MTRPILPVRIVEYHINAAAQSGIILNPTDTANNSVIIYRRQSIDTAYSIISNSLDAAYSGIIMYQRRQILPTATHTQQIPPTAGSSYQSRPTMTAAVSSYTNAPIDAAYRITSNPTDLPYVQQQYHHTNADFIPPTAVSSYTNAGRHRPPFQHRTQHLPPTAASSHQRQSTPLTPVPPYRHASLTPFELHPLFGGTKLLGTVGWDTCFSVVKKSTFYLRREGLGNENRVEGRPSKQLVAANEHVQPAVAEYIVRPYATNLSNG